MILHLPIPEPDMTARERVNWLLSCIVAHKQIAHRRAQPHVRVYLAYGSIEYIHGEW
jgi:hypothetical protein